MNETDYLTVTQLNRYAKRKFDNDPYLREVKVVGEVSGYRPKGKNQTQYFTLKDENSQIQAVIFGRDMAKVEVPIQEGQKYVVTGTVSLYAQVGKYEIYVRQIEPMGEGALYLEFQKLKKKLQEEGLFDQPKKPIPEFPKRIAVVTSKTGAVIQDIMRTIRERYPMIEVILYPTLVQGVEAPSSIIKQLKQVEADGNYDVVIVGRGGGSFEDLNSFNDEGVVRQIASMSMPIITSIGHQVDVTLSDFVGDKTVATPTAAAVAATPHLIQDLAMEMTQAKLSLTQILSRMINQRKEALENIKNSYIFQRPEEIYASYRREFEQVEEQLYRNMEEMLRLKKENLSQSERMMRAASPEKRLVQKQYEFNLLTKQLELAGKQLIQNQRQKINNYAKDLDYLSPLKRMTDGYVYAQKEDKPIQHVEDVQIGDALTLILSDGRIETEVKETLIDLIQPEKTKDDENGK